MKDSRRMKRMARAKKRAKASALNLTSLMDVFTILVFFLLVNQSATEILEPPREIELPESVVEAPPRQTVVIMVSPEQVLVQGEAVLATSELLEMEGDNIEAVQNRLDRIRENTIGIHTAAVAESTEVTILADKSIPYKVLRKLMSTSTNAGYNRISLAVTQKASQS